MDESEDQAMPMKVKMRYGSNLEIQTQEMKIKNDEKKRKDW